jgi:hypothetical protein
LELLLTLAAKRARRVSEGQTAAKAKWEAKWCSKHYGYRLKIKAGSKRSVPLTCVKPLAEKFYRLKSSYAPTGAYLKTFGHREDHICWGCRVGAVKTQENLFRHCSRWKDQLTTLWRRVGKATGCKAGRCQHVQMSEMFSTMICNQVVLDFLAATDVRKFPPRQAEECRQEEHGQEEPRQEEPRQEERGQEKRGQEEHVQEECGQE